MFDRELQIIAIHKGGSIDEWNQKEKARTATASEHPNDVRVGDFISIVNVVCGDGRRLLQEVNGSKRLRMYIKRRFLETDGPGSIRRFLKTERPPEKPPKRLCSASRESFASVLV